MDQIGDRPDRSGRAHKVGVVADALHGVAFAPDGRELYVGGAPVGTRAVSVYTLG